MTVSGTTTFNPNFATLMDESFERAGVDPAKNTSLHIRSAMLSMNLMLSAWAALGVKQWKVDQQTQSLVSGTATYNLASGTQDVEAVMFRQPNAEDGNDLDTRMLRIPREDYFQIPVKDLPSNLSSKYWIDRDLTTPTITIWPVPDSSSNQLIYLRLMRLNDAGQLVNTPDVPFYWFDALAAGWAARIAQKYNYDRYADLRIEAADALTLARTEDAGREDVRISYQCGGQ